MSTTTLFEKLGGYETLRRVHKIFYDKVYADNWLGLFFGGISQQVIENQQTDFMAQAMGGPQMYNGAFPIPAHKHMFITAELFDHRHELLKSALREANVNQENAEAWLKIDGAFRSALVKKSPSDCSPRFKTDDILIFPKPTNKKVA